MHSRRLIAFRGVSQRSRRGVFFTRFSAFTSAAAFRVFRGVRFGAAFCASVTAVVYSFQGSPD